MSDGPIFFQRWDDARINNHAVVNIETFDGQSRTANEVRAALARFRGEMLSRAYVLEHELDNLITWHLFGVRFDSGSDFFAEHFLQSGAFGLQHKTKLSVLILRQWDFLDEVDVAGAIKRLNDSKARRDRVAHWPTTLRPIALPGGEIVDFLPVMAKGNDSFDLTTEEQARWLAEADAAEAELRNISRHIFEHTRDFPED